ncbi:MAG: hypothetical protein ABSH51_07505 [Solirubrobacteraceae bacterium]|jgi:predicted transcriptional regulator
MISTDTMNGTPTVEGAIAQAKDLNEQVLSAGRHAGTLYLDAYEKAVEQTLELQLKVAGMTQQEWLKSLIEKQADFTREAARSYADSVRKLVK